MRLTARIHNILRDDDGTTAVEYAVMLAMVLMAVLAAIGAVGTQTAGMWGGIEGDLQEAGLHN